MRACSASASLPRSLSLRPVSSLLRPSPRPTSRSSATTLPTRRSSSRARSSRMPARWRSPSRSCAAKPTRRSRGAISAPACRSSARSSRSRRTRAPTGCGSHAPSCRSARPTTASARSCSSAPRPPPTSPTSAPAIAPRRRKPRDPRAHLRRPPLWRPALDALRLSLELREVAEVRAQYERLREDHGFRILDYTVDADAASPRACFQFSEELPGKRTDFSPFVALAGQDKPALSAEEKQLCVEGLKHGERYSVTLRAGLPSMVQGDAVEVRRLHHLRARPQAVRALHRQGLRAAAHRPARHSDRQRQHRQREGPDLSHRRPQPDRHGARRRFPAQPRPLPAAAARRRRAASRCGKASSRSSRRSTPTSPPRSRSTRRSATLQPGVYVMTAEPAKTKRRGARGLAPPSGSSSPISG